MIAVIGQTDLANVATRDDIHELRAAISGVRSDLSAESLKLRSELASETMNLRSEMLAKIETSKNEMMRWMFQLSIGSYAMIIGLYDLLIFKLF